RETPLTQAAPPIAEFARLASEAGGGDVLNTLHAVLERLHDRMAFEERGAAAESAAEAFARKRGVCQDFTHVFIAAARWLSIPARYVSGHLHRAGATEQPVGHAWAEAFVQGLGWVAFDAASGLCATDAYVRVATGLDFLGAAPVRGSRIGFGDAPEISVHVSHSVGQTQS